MFFLVDVNNKIIFGWSAKCGCSHIKNIYWFLQTDKPTNKIHKNDRSNLPDDIENYITLIFCRNPYKRIISGFLDKYKKNGGCRHLWKESYLSFSHFVDKLINCDWTTIDKHHFTPQTTEHFDNKILLSKIIKIYDICNIDYEYIEQLYNKNIPECVINKQMGHEATFRTKTNDCIENYVYDLDIDEYIDCNVDTKYFYNEEIKEKVFNFYINDFNFFDKNGIYYLQSPVEM